MPILWITTHQTPFIPVYTTILIRLFCFLSYHDLYSKIPLLIINPVYPSLHMFPLDIIMYLWFVCVPCCCHLFPCLIYHSLFNCLTSVTPYKDLHLCSASCRRFDSHTNSTLVNLLDDNRIYADHLVSLGI